MKIKINFENDDLWCVESKERIDVGERYVEVIEDEAVLTYKLEYAPVDNEDDDPYLG